MGESRHVAQSLLIPSVVQTDLQAICLRFCSLDNQGPNASSTKHSDAKHEEIWVFVQEGASPESHMKHTSIRLYPGGFGAVMLTEAHACESKFKPLKMSTRLVVFNWQCGTGLGVSNYVLAPDVMTDSRLS